MSDVFISYKREDEKRVAPLVSGLRKAGLSVWWDRDLPGGEAWRRKITEELEAARCVVVVWSSASVASEGEFVHEEAGRAKARGGCCRCASTPSRRLSASARSRVLTWSGGGATRAPCDSGTSLPPSRP